jgi:hypothetical protein
MPASPESSPRVCVAHEQLCNVDRGLKSNYLRLEGEHVRRSILLAEWPKGRRQCLLARLRRWTLPRTDHGHSGDASPLQRQGLAAVLLNTQGIAATWYQLLCSHFQRHTGPVTIMREDYYGSLTR